MEKFQLNKDRLRERREHLHISKQEAARRMNMSQPAYLRYESGLRMPSIHVINTMANVLHTSAEYLTDRTDDPTPSSYTISQQDNPALFHLVETYIDTDEKMRERLMRYLAEFESQP